MSNRTSPNSRQTKPAPDDDDVDSLELGTEVALIAFKALIESGVAPVDAGRQCWDGSEPFLVARKAWIAAMVAAYGD